MTDDDGAVTIGRTSGAALVVGAAARDGEGGVRVPVRLAAPGLAANAVIELESWNAGPARLAAFFDDLAARWRGWDGPKEWADDGGTFSMSASHDGKGLVVLDVRAGNLPYEWPGAWSARVQVPVEPGSLDGIALIIRRNVA